MKRPAAGRQRTLSSFSFNSISNLEHSADKILRSVPAFVFPKIYFPTSDFIWATHRPGNLFSSPCFTKTRSVR